MDEFQNTVLNCSLEVCSAVVMLVGNAVFSLNLSCYWKCCRAFCHDVHVCGHAYDACAFCDVLEGGNQAVVVVDSIQDLQGAFQVGQVVDDAQSDVDHDDQEDGAQKRHKVEDMVQGNLGLGMVAACLVQGMVQGLIQEDHKAAEGKAAEGKAAVEASHQAFLS